jgi:hypothetical protein
MATASSMVNAVATERIGCRIAAVFTPFTLAASGHRRIACSQMRFMRTKPNHHVKIIANYLLLQTNLSRQFSRGLLVSAVTFLFSAFPAGLYGNQSVPALHGIVLIGSVAYAAVEYPSGRSAWYVVGDRVQEFTVKAIHNSSVVLIEVKSRSELSIPLVGLPIPEASSKATEIIPEADLDWKWIRSEKNFMRDKPESPPYSAIVEWQTASDAYKVALRNFYRKHGWDITRMEARPDGSAHASIKPLHDPAVPLPTKEELDKVKQRATPEMLRSGQVKTGK